MKTFTLKLDGKPTLTFEADEIVVNADGSFDAWIRSTTAWHGKMFPGATVEHNGVAANSDGLPEGEKP